MLPALALTLLTVAVPAPTVATGSPPAPLIHEILAGRTPAAVELWDLARWREPLVALYGRQADAPLWHVRGRLTPAARALIRQLQLVEERGLLPADYDAAKLAALATSLDERRPATDESVASLDVALSVTAARLASDLHVGRVAPGQVGYELDVGRPALDVSASVAKLATAPDVAAALDALEPPFRHYALLKTALARYRALAQQPGLTEIPDLPGRSLRPDERYEGAPALRRLLAAFGDLIVLEGSSISADPVFDPELVAALVRFQARHGLDPDGILGARTFRALTTPLDARIRQISLSLERIRWLPANLESPPIIVNIPQFRLFAFRTTQDYAEDILQMDVIVGSAFRGRQTPVFAADMRYVVLHPYWDVPRGILTRELLPEIQADPGWVSRNGYEIVLGQGDDATPQPVNEQTLELLAAGRLRLRQQPGPRNALGHVKFMFPNRHNVYLHDTPARELFARSRRAFSHGCIRVADPEALLAHVLREEPTWTPERQAAALAGSAPLRVPLPRPVRVYILYGTALTVEAGQTLFFDDIYDQDERLNALLASRRSRVRSGAG